MVEQTEWTLNLLQNMPIVGQNVNKILKHNGTVKTISIIQHLFQKNFIAKELFIGALFRKRLPTDCSAKIDSQTFGIITEVLDTKSFKSNKEMLEKNSFNFNDDYIKQLDTILGKDTIGPEDYPIVLLCIAHNFAKFGGENLFGSSGQSSQVCRVYAQSLVNYALNLVRKKKEEH